MLTVAPLLLSFAPPQKLATDDPAAQRALFDDFKSRFSKSYATADEEALPHSTKQLVLPPAVSHTVFRPGAGKVKALLSDST